MTSTNFYFQFIICYQLRSDGQCVYQSNNKSSKVLMTNLGQHCGQITLIKSSNVLTNLGQHCWQITLNKSSKVLMTNLGQFCGQITLIKSSNVLTNLGQFCGQITLWRLFPFTLTGHCFTYNSYVMQTKSRHQLTAVTFTISILTVYDPDSDHEWHMIIMTRWW